MLSEKDTHLHTIVHAKPMSADYNETVSCWSLPCIRKSHSLIANKIRLIMEADPVRFTDVSIPFVVAEFGCATGYSSIETLTEVVKAVKELNPEKPVAVYLNDLPSNHHEIAIKTV